MKYFKKISEDQLNNKYIESLKQLNNYIFKCLRTPLISKLETFKTKFMISPTLTPEHKIILSRLCKDLINMQADEIENVKTFIGNIQSINDLSKDIPADFKCEVLWSKVIKLATTENAEKLAKGFNHEVNLLEKEHNFNL